MMVVLEEKTSSVKYAKSVLFQDINFYRNTMPIKIRETMQENVHAKLVDTITVNHIKFIDN